MRPPGATVEAATGVPRVGSDTTLDWPPPLQTGRHHGDNDALIPGTEGITPGPWVQLDNLDLEFANLAQFDFYPFHLTAASFVNSGLSSASFWRQYQAGADFTNAVVEGTDFNGTTTRGFTKEQLYSTKSGRVE